MIVVIFCVVGFVVGFLFLCVVLVQIVGLGVVLFLFMLFMVFYGLGMMECGLGMGFGGLCGMGLYYGGVFFLCGLRLSEEQCDKIFVIEYVQMLDV